MRSVKSLRRVTTPPVLKFTIGPCDGSENLINAAGLLNGIDQRQLDQSLDVNSEPTSLSRISVYPIADNILSAQELLCSFDYDLNNLAFTQHQIVKQLRVFLNQEYTVEGKESYVILFLLRHSGILLLVSADCHYDLPEQMGVQVDLLEEIDDLESHLPEGGYVAIPSLETPAFQKLQFF